MRAKALTSLLCESGDYAHKAPFRKGFSRDSRTTVSVEKSEKIVPTLFHYIETLKKYVIRKRLPSMPVESLVVRVRYVRFPGSQVMYATRVKRLDKAKEDL